MQIAVLGAGAIGGAIAGRLAAAGNDVSVVARGAHLEAMRQSGLQLEQATGDLIQVPVRAVASAAALGDIEVLFLCVKAHDLAKATLDLDPHLGANTIVVPVLNGIPWWYRLPGDTAPLRATDPDRTLSDRFAKTRLVGAVAHFAARIAAPGAIEETSRGRIYLGSVHGTQHDAEIVGQLLSAAGLESHLTTDIAREVWIKLAGNAAFNPVSALTGATMSTICSSPDLVAVVRTLMGEVMAVGERCGISFPITVDQRIEMASSIGGSKLSMLQDLERGRAVEVDALLGAISELGRSTGTSTTTIDTLAALVAHRARLNTGGTPL